MRFLSQTGDQNNEGEEQQAQDKKKQAVFYLGLDYVTEMQNNRSR